jgi:molybdopterin synthase sulfur carrier subunit
MATRILFFGPLKEAAGCGERTVDLPPQVKDAASLIEYLADGDAYVSDALSASSVKIAVDKTIIGPGAPIHGAEEIAFMPPFSGG